MTPPQGVEAQTLAHAYLAADSGLEMVPVINKIDLPSAEPERVKKEIEDIVGISTEDAVLASAKDGNVDRENIKTEYVDGVLRLTLPRKQDEPSKKIEVN